MANDQTWNYFKEKSLNELISNAFDSTLLFDEYREHCPFDNISEEELSKKLTYFTKLATNILYSISDNVTISLKPEEMQQLLHNST